MRQLATADAHEHNIYYPRNVWNADNSLMVGVYSDLEQKNWRIVLHNGDGCYQKELFPISQYNWQLSWDRNDPNVLYTNKVRPHLRLNVGSLTFTELVNPGVGANLQGPSLNQDSTRIGMPYADGTFKSWRSPTWEGIDLSPWHRSYRQIARPTGTMCVMSATRM